MTQASTNSILHPTDFSPGGRLAFEHALALALKTKCALTLLHVREDHEAIAGPSGLKPVVETLVRWRRLRAGATPESLKRELGLEVTSLVVPGRDFRAGILDHLDEHPYDLAVIATREHKGLSHWVDNSVERRALRMAKTPTLFLRQGQRGFINPTSGEINLARVLAPLDGRPEGARTLTSIIDFIDELSRATEVKLLHVGDAPFANPAPDLTLLHRDGSPVEAILGAAGSWRADLIAMPTAGRHGLLDAMRGSVTAKILDDARFPVLSMPAA